jgi:flagellar assembly protein FliH
MAQVIRSVQVENEPVVLTYGVTKQDAAPAAPSAPLVSEPLPLVAPLPEMPPAPPPVDFAELQKQAFDDGYRDGYEKGEAEARAEHKKHTETQTEAQAQAFAQMLGAARQALDAQIEGLEDVVVEIAFAAVCKLLGESAFTEGGTRGLVREAMRGIAAKERLVMRVSPADHRALAASAEPRVEVVADERVTLGGCIIETSGGTLDARLEVQLRQLIDTLTRARQAQAE